MDEVKAPVKQTTTPLVGPGTILEASFEVYKKLWKQLLVLAIFPYLSIILLAVAAVGVIALIVLLFSSHNYAASIAVAAIAIVAAVVYLSITFSIGGVAQIFVIASREKPISVGEALKKAWKVLWAYWAVGFLVSVMVLGGYLFFIIPGIIFSIWFMFAVYVVALEGIGGMDALMKSREYVRGRWWSMLGRWLLIVIVVYAISYIPYLLLNGLHYKLAASIVQPILSLIATPLATAYFVLTYENVKTVSPVQTVPGKGKYLYITISVIGLLLLLLLIFLGVYAGVTAYQNILQHPAHYSPPQNKQLPNFT